MKFMDRYDLALFGLVWLFMSLLGLNLKCSLFLKGSGWNCYFELNWIGDLGRYYYEEKFTFQPSLVHNSNLVQLVLHLKFPAPMGTNKSSPFKAWFLF